MKRLIVLFFCSVFIGSCCFCFAAADKSISGTEGAQGMEIKNVGGINFNVPSGTKIEKKDGMMRVEGASSYAARNFSELETRITKIENKQNELSREIEQIKAEM